jgi:hypothetical protein
MRTFISFYSAAFILFITMEGCSSSRKDQQTQTASVTGNWQQQPLTIDGLDDDWTNSPLPYLEASEKLKYAITNDGDNIYIRMATKDPLEQQKIIQGGMTVWINYQGQKTYEEAVGIGYPTDSRNSREKTLMAEASRDKDKNRDKPVSLDDCRDYSLYNFPKEEAIANYEYGHPNNADVSVKMNFNNSGSLIYEASIPIASVFPKNNSTGKTIAVGIFVEGVPGAPTRAPGDGGGVSVGGGLGFGSFGSGGGLGLSIGSGSLARIGGKKSGLGKQAKIWQVLPIARPAR